MILKNYYYYFTSAIPAKICDRIISEATQQKPERGLVDNKEFKSVKPSNKEISKVKKVRESHVVWLNKPWIYKLIQSFVYEANEKAGWNFQWSWTEATQFTIYKKNQHYNWHADQYDYLDKNNRIRKISMTINLSDPKDYEGGVLEFDFRNQNNRSDCIVPCTQIAPKGSIAVFPSFVFHRVTPVTKGTRYSIVAWNCGDPYK